MMSSEIHGRKRLLLTHHPGFFLEGMREATKTRCG